MPRKTRWFTSRKMITAVGVTIASTALFKGKMSDTVWVYAMAVFIAGHHAADLIKVWKGNDTPDADLGGGEHREWKDAGAAQSDQH